MTRDDTNVDFWKEKFVYGLPTLFAQKVKNRITRKHGGTSILYSQYTYGALISECIAEGLSLCNNIKLKAQQKPKILQAVKKLVSYVTNLVMFYSSLVLVKSPVNLERSFNLIISLIKRNITRLLRVLRLPDLLPLNVRLI